MDDKTKEQRIEEIRAREEPVGTIVLPDQPGVYSLAVEKTGLYEIAQAQARVARVKPQGGPNRAARRAAVSKRKGGAK